MSFKIRVYSPSRESPMCVGKAESNLTQVGKQLRECLSAKECAVRCGAVSAQRGMSEAQRRV